MAERRMFAKTIIDSDAFLEMPQSSQNLYFHLAMRADDDGFVNNPKKIVRMVNGSEDDFKLLIAKHFIIPFEVGVVVIRHWRIHNYIQKDRYSETLYKQEKESLLLVDGMYTKCIQDVDKLDTQVRLGKDRLGKVSLVEVACDSKESSTRAKKFIIPTILEIQEYCNEANIGIDTIKFFNYYESNGWQVGKNKMKDWKAAVRNWERNNYGKNDSRNEVKKDYSDFEKV